MFIMAEMLRYPQSNVNAINAMASFCDLRNNGAMDIADWIRRGLLRSGKTQRGLAAALGIDPSGVNRMLKGERQLRADEIERVASYLGTEPPTAPGQSVYSKDVDPSHIVTGGLVGDRDLPVYASAMGGDGEMIVSYEPIEYVKRPSVLEGVPGGFAMFVVGDSMEPRYEPGELLLVHPKKTALPGDDVLVVKINGNDHDNEAMVKRLVRFSGSVYRLKQYNPANEFDLPAAEVKNCFVVVGSYGRRR